MAELAIALVEGGTRLDRARASKATQGAGICRGRLASQRFGRTPILDGSQ